MWFDSHCHLYELRDEAQAAMERAAEAGVTGILVVGVDPSTSETALELARGDGVWAGAAYHPSEVKGWKDEWADDVAALLEDDDIVAVGETGIDLYWDDTYLDDQKAAFEAHIALAKRHDKALVIHTRNSLDEALEILGSVGPPDRVVFHCWSGESEHLRRALDLGAYISFAGNVSFKNAQNLREAARDVPTGRLLIETDTPFLTPVPLRGTRNEPAYVVFVGAALAEARGEEVEDVARLTTANARLRLGLEA
jgi:TatD DNase family protein